MHMNDGRVVSNFILQAIQEHPITVSSTRSCTQFISMYIHVHRACTTLVVVVRSRVCVCTFQVYGDGKQTRSFQYVSDLVDGLMALMRGNYSLPVNIGNPEEYTIMEFAQRIRKLAGTSHFLPSLLSMKCLSHI